MQQKEGANGSGLTRDDSVIPARRGKFRALLAVSAAMLAIPFGAGWRFTAPVSVTLGQADQSGAAIPSAEETPVPAPSVQTPHGGTNEVSGISNVRADSTAAAAAPETGAMPSGGSAEAASSPASEPSSAPDSSGSGSPAQGPDLYSSPQPTTPSPSPSRLQQPLSNYRERIALTGGAGVEYSHLTLEGGVVVKTPDWILMAPEVEYNPETATLRAPRLGHLLTPAGQEVATGEVEVCLVSGAQGRALKLMLPNALKLSGVTISDALSSISAVAMASGVEALPVAWAGPSDARLPEGVSVEIPEGNLHQALRSLAAQLDLRFRYTADRVVMEPAANSMRDGEDTMQSVTLWQRGTQKPMLLSPKVPGHHMSFRLDVTLAFGRLVFQNARVSSSVAPSPWCEFVEAETMTWMPDDATPAPIAAAPASVPPPTLPPVSEVPAPGSPADRIPTAHPIEEIEMARLESRKAVVDDAVKPPGRSTQLEAEGSVRILDAQGQQKLGCAQLLIRLPIPESGVVAPILPATVVDTSVALLPGSAGTNSISSTPAAPAQTPASHPAAASSTPAARVTAAAPVKIGRPGPGNAIVFRAHEIGLETLSGAAGLPAGTSHVPGMKRPVPKVTGTRDVEVRGGGLHLFADYFEIDPISGLGTARGTVRIMSRDGGVEYSLAPVQFAVDMSTGLGLADVRFTSVMRGDLSWKAGRMEGSAIKAAISPLLAPAPASTNLGVPTIDTDPDGGVGTSAMVTLPDEQSHVIAAEARRLWEARRYDEAAARYESILKLHPGSLLALGNLAALRIITGKAEEGKAMITRAEEIAARDAFAMSALGLILHKAGRLPEAVGTLIKAARLEPRDARTRLYLGLSLAGTGKLEQGIDECRRALELRSSYPEAAMQLAVLLLRRQPPSILEARPYYAQAIVLGMPRQQSVEDILEARIEMLAPFESQHGYALATGENANGMPGSMAGGPTPMFPATQSPATQAVIDTSAPPPLAPAPAFVPAAPPTTTMAQSPVSSPLAAPPASTTAAAVVDTAPVPSPAAPAVPSLQERDNGTASVPASSPSPGQQKATAAAPSGPAQAENLEDTARLVRLPNGLTFDNSGMTKVVVTLEEASARLIKEAKIEGPFQRIKVIFDRNESDPPAPRVTVTIPPGSTMDEAVRLIGQSIQAKVAYGKRAIYFKPRKVPTGTASGSGSSNSPAAKRAQPVSSTPSAQGDGGQAPE
ncbi:MAG TPA: tetratricopeptide repeat protein [Candidatus Methylacidiphilales bacterium]|nr:tetratricopeptide repeat protein [Candidatus Methylacidiphilales bacterium]